MLPLALALDKLYIPTRYPDALPGLIPKEAYTREEAEEALAHAQLLLVHIRQAFDEDEGRGAARGAMPPSQPAHEHPLYPGLYPITSFPSFLSFPPGTPGLAGA
ncbi:HEPN domain-containing protein [Thermus caliditerrae]|uniref:HEPN domain-containing protein n=1 Tax=Thermus caliditerrae TaxID=1330700 RepID=UPI001F1AF449|nr:HEPN domain-containing protein [Thermus caliditerrae]